MGGFLFPVIWGGFLLLLSIEKILIMIVRCDFMFMTV